MPQRVSPSHSLADVSQPHKRYCILTFITRRSSKSDFVDKGEITIEEQILFYIQSGEIKEEGTHKQLLRKKDGLYRRLWELQAGGFIA